MTSLTLYATLYTTVNFLRAKYPSKFIRTA